MSAQEERLKSLLTTLPRLCRWLGEYHGKGLLLTAAENSLSPDLFFLSALSETAKKPLLMIVSNLQVAEQAAHEFSNWFNPKHIQIFPDWDTLPFEVRSPDERVQTQRMQVLYNLHKEKVAHLIAPVGAMLQKVPLPELTVQRSVELEKGRNLNYDTLLNKLIEMGYRQSFQTTDRGYFSRRGGIIDIFPFQEERPLRLEWEGNTLKSTRYFDPATQLSQKAPAPGKVVLLPVHEFSITSVEHKLHSSLPDEILDALKEKRYIEGIEHLLPCFEDTFEFLSLIKYSYIPVIYNLQNIRKEAEYIEKEINNYSSRPNFFFAEKQKDFYITFDHLLSNIYGKDDMVLFARTPKRAKPFMSVLTSVPPLLETLPYFDQDTAVFAQYIQKKLMEKNRVLIPVHTKGLIKRLQNALKDEGLDMPALPDAPSSEKLSDTNWSGIFHQEMNDGFFIKNDRLCLLPASHLYGKPRLTAKTLSAETGSDFTLADLYEIQSGDYVVHLYHGIGIYRGMHHIDVDGVHRDYLLLEYAEGDKLYVPFDQMQAVQKYIGGVNAHPVLYRLGGGRWKKVTKSVQKSVRDLANELLELYAIRQNLGGYSFPQDTEWFDSFCESFEYDETPDQLKSFKKVYKDMEKNKPMDRLICGDVGYGKTEIALRASFKAVMHGKQVGILTPTTILAQQHLTTFSRRMVPYAVNVKMLSRFKTKKEQKEIIEDLKNGSIDIVIGTHRLIQRDVNFKNLGLVIIDEEQRFGVRHKERLKQFRKIVDVLTMTATPIPRTLNMSMMGVRDISIINSPPAGRQPIETNIIKWNAETIREGILREIRRGGQVFFVHNRIETIESIRIYLLRLLPDISIGVAHGRLEEKKLERVMVDFLNSEYDVLLTTTIIESGLDIPNVNTMFIHQAERFGLAQLYQLRGRIGRGDRKAYAYLIPSHDRTVNSRAYKRLETLKQFSEPGSGFKIAMRDLELRGAGNILGPEQHGNISAVGFELYCSIMENAVKELKGETIIPEITSTIEIKCDAYIPPEYVSDDKIRFQLYKKVSAIKSTGQIKKFLDEIIDRFGQPPPAVVNLTELIRLKILAFETRASYVGESNGKIEISFPPDKTPSRKQIQKIIDKVPELRWFGGMKPHFIVEKNISSADEKILTLSRIFEKWQR